MGPMGGLEPGNWDGLSIDLELEDFEEELDEWAGLEAREKRLLERIDELSQRRKRTKELREELETVKRHKQQIMQEHWYGFLEAAHAEKAHRARLRERTKVLGAVETEGTGIGGAE